LTPGGTHNDARKDASRHARPCRVRAAARDKRGYVAVPLAQDDEGFTVGRKSGSEEWRMLLDTGAENPSLDTGLVRKLGLKPQGEVMTIGADGPRKGVGVFLRGFSIGDFDTRATANALPLRTAKCIDCFADSIQECLMDQGQKRCR
jgi:predicted aspartyl protease